MVDVTEMIGNYNNSKNTMKLYKKIYFVQKEIGSLIKNEINKFQNYQYFNEYQVLTKLRPLLDKYDLLILTSDENSSLEYQKEEKGYVIKYLKKIQIICSETSDKMEVFFWAVGSNADLAKAKGSAETYAMKYFLSKFFLMPVTDSLDPDYSK
ncbi:MAG TPA: ERF family protein [Mycoplasmatales bacterium]|jgi:hypothetical protein|nr:ERF family protein [Mycoplasmatales bacterium]